MARTAFTNKKHSLRERKSSSESQQRSPMAVAGKTARKHPVSVKVPRITEPIEETPKKTRKFTKMVLKEIQYYQQTSNMLMSKMPFVRLVRSTVDKLCTGEKGAPMRFTRSSLEALQEAFEAFIVSLFEKAYSCTIHAKRVTLHPSDLRLARKLDN